MLPGCDLFEFRPGYRLSWLRWSWFVQSIHATAGYITSMRQWSLHTKSLLRHHSLRILQIGTGSRNSSAGVVAGRPMNCGSIRCMIKRFDCFPKRSYRLSVMNVNGRDIKLTALCHLMPKLRISGATTPLPLYAFMKLKWTTLQINIIPYGQNQ